MTEFFESSLFAGFSDKKREWINSILKLFPDPLKFPIGCVLVNKTAKRSHLRCNEWTMEWKSC